MDKLNMEEVLHVAKLAKLELNEEEIDKYSYELRQILDEIEKINDIEVEDSDILIAPWSIDGVLRDDVDREGLKIDEVLRNVPVKIDNFTLVRGVLND